MIMDIFLKIIHLFIYYLLKSPAHTNHNCSHIAALSIRTRHNTVSGIDHAPNVDARLGIDSHADISCAGRHARIMEVVEGEVCTVHAFNDSMKPIKNVQTVNVAYAVDTPTGSTFILRVNHSLDFTSSMENSILCTNQARCAGIVVDDVPKILDVLNTSTQSVTFPKEQVHIPIEFYGPVPYLPIRYPTDEDIDSCQHLDITPNELWDPSHIGISSILYQPNEYYDKYSHDNDVFNCDLYGRMEDKINISSYRKTSDNQDFTPELLSELWDIGLPCARKTHAATTHDHIRLVNSAGKRVKTMAHQRAYKQLSGYLSQFASDTFKSNVISTRGNKYFQLFCNRGNFTTGTPIKRKGAASEALDKLIHTIGVMTEMLTDGAKELHLADWGKTCRTYKIRQRLTEPHSPWQNPAELTGGIIKRRVRRCMKKSNTPLRLWDYCWEYQCELRSLTATDHIQLDGVTPFSKIHGYTPNIAEYIQFKWFQWVWFNDPDTPEKERLGRWCGAAHDCGQGMAYNILSNKGNVLTRSTVTPLKRTEEEQPETVARKAAFMKEMEDIIGNYCNATISNTEIKSSDDPYESLFEDDDLPMDDEPPMDTTYYTDPPYTEDSDNLVGAKIPLQHKGEIKEGEVVSRKRDSSGMLIGTQHINPIMDSREYQVQFPDGSYTDYSANLLLENLHSQVDVYGHTMELLKGIIDHRIADDAISKENGWVQLASGAKKRIVTTRGWDLLVEFKDGTTSWRSLSELKEANPIELAEYARSRGIESEPAFAWWSNHVLKKRKILINKLRARMTKKHMKFGIDVPTTVLEANRLDTTNKNDLWAKAIEKELKNVIVAFQLLEHDELIPVGSKEISYHFIFDVKFDLTRKARLVADGHRHKDVPSHLTYSSVASRESVRMGFLLAALNDLDIMACDIGNAYLNAPNREKVHVTVGAELFGKEHEGKKAIIVRALYGLKSAGAAWRSMFANAIQHELGYHSCPADPDVWMKAKVKKNGEKYYSYIIVYVDDVLCIDETPKQIISHIADLFRIKEGSDEVPKIYLGANIRKWNVTDEDGKESQCWAMSSHSYAKEAVRVVEAQMLKHNLSYPSSRRHGSKSPFSSSSYRPELDYSDLCSEELATLYMELIGMLRWMCELGRIDILHETALLSQYMASPRMGHLLQAINTFKYVKTHDRRSWLVFDPLRYDVEWIPFGDETHPEERAAAMREMYDVSSGEEMPHNMPEARGNPVDINIFVDADHAGNKITRRSHTGIIIFLNMAPIAWYSKKQNTVESSTFTAEFIALKTAIEMLDGLLYKLRMLGVPISGPARVFCDNQSVVKNSSFPDSVLKKKHCSIAYHKVREAIAYGKCLIYFERSETNLADLFTKVVSPDKRESLIPAFLSG